MKLTIIKHIRFIERKNINELEGEYIEGFRFYNK